MKKILMVCLVALWAALGSVTPALATEESSTAKSNPDPVELVSMVAGEPVNVSSFVWAVPVLGKNVEKFLRLTGWKLMIEGNGLDTSEEEWIEKGVKVAVMSEGTDRTRQMPQYWSAYHGQMERVGEEWVVHLFFWAGDPNRD